MERSKQTQTVKFTTHYFWRYFVTTVESCSLWCKHIYQRLHSIAKQCYVFPELTKRFFVLQFCEHQNDKMNMSGWKTTLGEQIFTLNVNKNTSTLVLR